MGGDQTNQGGHEAPTVGPSAGRSGGTASGGFGAGQAVTGPGREPATGTTASAIARSGVTCGPGVRQVAWTAYAPPCVPKYIGNNGGATSYGVTKDTITVTFRIGSAAALSAYNATGSYANSVGTDQQQTLKDLRTYFDVFNRTYELYGRKVVIKPFEGQSDILLELQGQSASGAQQDAATAKDLGAFGDVSLITQTQLYASSLASQKIASFSGLYFSQQWFDAHAPYGYSFYPASNRVGQFAGRTVCDRMAGLKADFAGDDLTKAKSRAFGLMHPENAVYVQGADALVKTLKDCGVELAARVQYSADLATGPSQATNAMTQMQKAGVTTILCLCDVTTPTYMTSAADKQSYYPEWFQAVPWTDPSARGYSQKQWAHAIMAGGRTPAQGEAYRVYKMGNPAGPPPDDLAYPKAYREATLLFNALQAAGPNLTPASMARGLFSQESSPKIGEWGAWTFGRGVYTPQSSFQLGWWSSSAKSGLDGQAGSYQNCERGTWFKFDAAAIGRRGTQLACFGAT